MLDELCRVTRRGGTIRVTESTFPQSNSPALTQLFDLATKAAYRAGHFFQPTSGSVLNELPRLLRQHGIQHLQTRSHILEFRADAPGWQNFYEDMAHLFHTIIPFCRRWTRIPDNYEEIYQQALREMLQPDFAATWTLLTAWGESPSRQNPAEVILD